MIHTLPNKIKLINIGRRNTEEIVAQSRPFAQIWLGNEVRGIAGENWLRLVCWAFELSFSSALECRSAITVVVLAVPIEVGLVLFFQSFPRSSELRKRWLLAIRQANWSNFRVQKHGRVHSAFPPWEKFLLSCSCLRGCGLFYHQFFWNWGRLDTSRKQVQRHRCFLFARMSPKWAYEACRHIERRHDVRPHRRLWANWWGYSPSEAARKPEEEVATQAKFAPGGFLFKLHLEEHRRWTRSVCMCVCVSKWKEIARRMARTTSKNRKRKEKKSTEQEEAHFVSRVTGILTWEKERDYLLNLHMSQSTCFGTWIETGVNFYGWEWVPRASTVQKGEHVKDIQAKLSNVEITSIADVEGRLLSCVRRALSYTWHRKRHVEIWLRTCAIKLLAHAHSNWHTHSGDEKKKNQSIKKEGRKNKREEVRPNSPN